MNTSLLPEHRRVNSSDAAAGRMSRTKLSLLLATVFFVVYAAYSLTRHARMLTAGYDLGIFDQAIRSYSEFQSPIVPLKAPGFNLLGDHFHPILSVLAPLYWVWPDARMLLVAQAALVAISIIPISRLALQRLSQRNGIAVSIAYALSWGLQGVVAFDFHEVAFAVPILAFAMCALAQERWRSAVLWSLALVLVKEDLGLTVAAVGSYMCLNRQWRWGFLGIVAGVAATAMSIKVLIPAFNPRGVYAYTGALNAKGSFLHHAFAIVSPHQKLLLVLMLLVATAGSASLSPLLIVALPGILARLHSDNSLYWVIDQYHYNAALMPILFVALVDGISRMRRSPRAWLRRYGDTVPPIVLVVALVLVPALPFRSLIDPDFYRVSKREKAALWILRQVPNGASVAASNYLVPQLVDRTDVVLFPRFYAERQVDWIVVETRRLSVVPDPVQRQLDTLRALPTLGFRLVDSREGIILYRRVS